MCNFLEATLYGKKRLFCEKLQCSNVITPDQVLLRILALVRFTTTLEISEVLLNRMFSIGNNLTLAILVIWDQLFEIMSVAYTVESEALSEGVFQ